jgi:hypothetical protein
VVARSTTSTTLEAFGRRACVRLVLASEMAQQHVGRISEFHFNEVRQLMRGRDADIGKDT